MQVFHTITALQGSLADARRAGFRIGLVPTMGALHSGHISLVERCGAENEVTVVSIFVNPTQFNDPRDLAVYPRTLPQDLELLRDSCCTHVFAPSVEEMYPEPDHRAFHFGALEQVMEGVRRPGHFNGVAQIVSKLFEATVPHSAYFGEKDFQQLAIIRAMVRQLQLPVRIVGCPIVREPDGLAMSSRNRLLTPEHRKSAVLISDTLLKSVTLSRVLTIEALCEWVEMRINADPLLQTEYFAIVDREELQPARFWGDPRGLQGCIAVQAGQVRLIDNIAYE